MWESLLRNISWKIKTLSFELNELIQKIKSENNEETKDLFSTINSLREQLDQLIFEKNKAVQETISQKNDEMSQLKLSLNKYQLENLKFRNNKFYIISKTKCCFRNYGQDLKSSASVLR